MPNLPTTRKYNPARHIKATASHLSPISAISQLNRLHNSRALLDTMRRGKPVLRLRSGAHQPQRSASKPSASEPNLLQSCFSSNDH